VKHIVQGLLLFQTFSGKGKTLTETWERCIKIDGDYIFEKGENLESYFKATGDTNMLTQMDCYKMHLRMSGNTLHMIERLGDLGTFSNILEMGVEAPFFCPRDKKGIHLLFIYEL
jgi:hypothetical protein